MSQTQQSSQQSKTSGSPKSSNHIKQTPIICTSNNKFVSKTKNIIINLSMTHYEVVTDVAEQLEWKIQYNNKKGDWDVLWIDSMVEPDTLMKMHFFQKISHFPGIYVLARKNLLGLHFNEMAKKFPNDYNFFPKTWLLPAQFGDFRQEVLASQENKKCFIVKPEADCQGRGIFLTFKTDEVQNGRHYVVQQYLASPFLVDGLKFDFRVYVLLSGTNPMRLYVYEEGLARFSTEKYEKPHKNNLKTLCMHLTNYAINKKSPKYIFNTDKNNMDKGHKRTLTSVYKYIQKRGLNIQSFKSKLYDVLIKTMIIGQPLISHQYKFAQPDDEYHNMCFHILGIDVMIDQMLNPYVIQVNHTPSFVTDTPLDYFVKFNLIKDTLNLMNINESSKKYLIKKTNSYVRERITNVKQLIETEEQKQRIKQAQKQRDEYEKKNMGKYVKVFPLQGQQNQQQMQKYNEFLKQAQKVYFNDNNVIRLHIEKDRQMDIKQKQQTKIINKQIHKGQIKNNKEKFRLLSGRSNYSKNKLEQKTELQSLSLKSSFKTQHSVRKYVAKSEKIVKDKTNVSSVDFHQKNSRNMKAVSLLSKPNESITLNNSQNPSSRQEFMKFTKSISDVKEQSLLTSSGKTYVVKNLPKIENPSSPTKKNSVLESSKVKYGNLRKKRQCRQDRIRQSLNSNKESNPGKYVRPKVIEFSNKEELESLTMNEKMQKNCSFGPS